jgi:branched-chain amino acid transport system ATP-binding protein
MLAIGRALMLNPRLLILDEATEGLAPVVREEIWSVLRRLRERGHSVLVVDKHLPALAALCDRAVILEKGRTVWTGPSADLAADTTLHDRYLSV